jgi:hypothetical protein
MKTNKELRAEMDLMHKQNEMLLTEMDKDLSRMHEVFLGVAIREPLFMGVAKRIAKAIEHFNEAKKCVLEVKAIHDES